MGLILVALCRLPVLAPYSVMSCSPRDGEARSKLLSDPGLMHMYTGKKYRAYVEQVRVTLSAVSRRRWHDQFRISNGRRTIQPSFVSNHSIREPGVEVTGAGFRPWERIIVSNEVNGSHRTGVVVHP